MFMMRFISCSRSGYGAISCTSLKLCTAKGESAPPIAGLQRITYRLAAKQSIHSLYTKRVI